MATKRFGYLDDLSLKNQKVGIGTSTANEKLEVLGGTKGGDVVVTGIATLTSYSGFQNKNTSYVENLTIDSGESGTLSGEIVIGAGLTMSVGTGATTGQGSIKSLKVSNTFTPPIGGTNDRPSAPQPGAIFYNKDFRTIEYWDGNFWRQVDNTTSSGRGIIAGGSNPLAAGNSIIFSIEIPTLGNAVHFGDLTLGRSEATSVSNSIRGIICGGYRHAQSPNYSNILDYVTIASAGNAIDFGDAVGGEKASDDSGCSSSTRGLFMGGNYFPGSNDEQIEYVEIMTTGNSIDFGDLMDDNFAGGGVSNGTRGIVAGGNGGSYGTAPAMSLIQHVTISSLGNAVRFGDLTFARNCLAAGCSSTRGIFAGGYNPTNGNGRKIDYITMASTGHAIYFGDLVASRPGWYMSGASTQTRMVFAGSISGSYGPHIQYVEMATTGEAMDFGECLHGTNNTAVSMFSDSHGGLGGF